MKLNRLSIMFHRMMFIQGIVICAINLALIEALPSSATRLELPPLILTPNIIERYGYISETHHVTTEDGYIVEMHRIPYGRERPTTGRRPPVLLMHGIMGASSNFVAVGADYSIGFNLADAGFDVWMGNARGSRDSRRHVTLDPDGEEEKFKFWDFSWEEIGLYDIPAMTDYVRASTGFDKIHYIGHSQGGTVFLIMNSMRPEYNDKFASAHLLAPASYKEHFPNTILSGLSLLVDTIYNSAVNNGLVEIGRNVLDILDISNGEHTRDIDIWTAIIKEIRGVNVKTDDDLQSIMDPSFFGGAALKQVAHYGQNVRSRNFQRWDYGLLRNREIYGTLRPPQYDLSLVTVETTLHYSFADNLVGAEDILRLERDMPNAVARRVPDDRLSHIGFTFNPAAKELITDYIIEKMFSADM